jgi:hypothetical protein
MQRVRRPYFDRLRTDVEQWPDTALLSAEALAVMEADGIDLLLGALPVARVDIVLTARDLGRVLPSSWQQNLRNGRSGSFDAYLAAIKEARGTTDPSQRS